MRTCGLAESQQPVGQNEVGVGDPILAYATFCREKIGWDRDLNRGL